ncbi:MAG: hypothetical protein KAS32_17535 [Candidatus Peribacteraceae bacterium]|nr:hypothetical protein [Candidatus Peribacteraceae bacterium]
MTIIEAMSPICVVKINDKLYQGFNQGTMLDGEFKYKDVVVPAKNELREELKKVILKHLFNSETFVGIAENILDEFIGKDPEPQFNPEQGE